MDGKEIAVYYTDNSIQYFSKNVGGQVTIKYFAKSGNSSLTYTPGTTNYNQGLLSYDNVRDFALIDLGSFYDRFTYDETKELYVFDGAEDNKTLSSNVILQNKGCKYSYAEVSFTNGNITKIYAVASEDESIETLEFTDHGTTSIKVD